MIEYSFIVVYLFFGITPSIVWLFYYLRKDLHPEPKKMIARLFFYGALVTIPTLMIQEGLFYFVPYFQSFVYPMVVEWIRWFLMIAFIEEVLKYLVVRLTLFKNAALDEPLDIMMYMVVVALGFAAIENTLFVIIPTQGISFYYILQKISSITLLRFLGATFLHTLCSALIGYFVALSLYEPKKKWRFLLMGIGIATLLHGLYDLSIMTINDQSAFIIPIIIIAGLAFFIMNAFEKIKKMKSVSMENLTLHKIIKK